jgi:transcriptional regulator with XRE-family HTH domain
MSQPSDPLIADFAARIKRVRTRLALTQDDFARMLGVAPKTVSEWERGLGLPRAKARRKLAGIFAAFEENGEEEEQEAVAAG